MMVRMIGMEERMCKRGQMERADGGEGVYIYRFSLQLQEV
jgi:hypothetical protein